MKVYTFQWKGQRISAIAESMIEAMQQIYTDSNGEIIIDMKELIST